MAKVDRGARSTIRFEVNVAPNQSSVKQPARLGPWLRAEEAKHGPDRESDDSEPQRDHAQPVCESRIATSSLHRFIASSRPPFRAGPAGRARRQCLPSQPIVSDQGQDRARSR